MHLGYVMTLGFTLPAQPRYLHRLSVLVSLDLHRYMKRFRNLLLRPLTLRLDELRLDVLWLWLVDDLCLGVLRPSVLRLRLNRPGVLRLRLNVLRLNWRRYLLLIEVARF